MGKKKKMIDWKNFNELESKIKRIKEFKIEQIERMTIFLNLNSPIAHQKALEEKIRKIPAFNEYLAFKEMREIWQKEACMIIKSPYDLPYREKNYFDELIKNPYKLQWDITPYFNIMLEPCRLIKYGEKGYCRMDGGDKFAHDLLHGLRAYGILEFCPDKKENFEKFDPQAIFRKR